MGRISALLWFSLTTVVEVRVVTVVQTLTVLYHDKMCDRLCNTSCFQVLRRKEEKKLPLLVCT